MTATASATDVAASTTDLLIETRALRKEFGGLVAVSDVDFQLVLRQSDVPMTHVSAHSRLGWNTWCRRKPYPRHAEDATLSVSDRVCINR